MKALHRFPILLLSGIGLLSPAYAQLKPTVPPIGAVTTTTAPSFPADLQIVNLVFPASFNQADRVDYSFALKNNGPGLISIPANARLYSLRVDGREFATADAWSPRVLGPGESIPVRGNLPLARTWFATPGAHTLTIGADPDNRFAEANENNNTATQAVNVAALPVSDVVFASAVIDPPNPSTTTPFKVIITLSNRGPDAASLSGRIIDSPDCPGVNVSTNFSLAAGASRSFDLSALRDWYQVGSRTCSVVIGGVQNDPDPSNNRGTFSFTIAR